MPERAHPDIRSFKKKFRLRWSKGLLPKVVFFPSPYSRFFYWRYAWANRFCRGKKVLEIPCGMGWGTSLLTRARYVAGVDVAAEAVQEARRRYAGKNREFVVGSMQALHFKKETFDIVICLEGIEHVDRETAERFLREAYRTLKPGGLLLVSSPRHATKEHSGNPYHIVEYTLQELTAMIEPCFIICSVQMKEVDDLLVYYVEAKKR